MQTSQDAVLVLRVLWRVPLPLPGEAVSEVESRSRSRSAEVEDEVEPGEMEPKSDAGE